MAMLFFVALHFFLKGEAHLTLGFPEQKITLQHMYFFNLEYIPNVGFPGVLTAGLVKAGGGFTFLWYFLSPLILFVFNYMVLLYHFVIHVVIFYRPCM